MLRRLPVSNSADFEVSAERLWEAISEPGNLNDSHPFCDSNEVISWEDGNRSDRLVYLSGLNYVRRFKTWEEGVGAHWPVGGHVLGSVHDGLLIKPVFLNTLRHRTECRARGEKRRCAGPTS